MNRDAVINYLRGLTAKQFAEIFYSATKGQHPWPEDKKITEARHVLAYAHREKGSPDATWEVNIICPVPNENWVDDAPICQQGSHCGFETMSWAKHSICPICGGEVYGT